MPRFTTRDILAALTIAALTIGLAVMALDRRQTNAVRAIIQSSAWFTSKPDQPGDLWELRVFFRSQAERDAVFRWAYQGDGTGELGEVKR